MGFGDCLLFDGTLDIEDISFNRLQFWCWVLPLLMLLSGVLSQAYYMLYLKKGHPWRSLLQSDKDVLETWRCLDIWKLISQNMRNVEEHLEDLDQMQEKNISEPACQDSLMKGGEKNIDELNEKKMM